MKWGYKRRVNYEERRVDWATGGPGDEERGEQMGSQIGSQMSNVKCKM